MKPPLSYEESLTCGHMFKPHTSAPGWFHGAYEKLARQVAFPDTPKFPNGCSGFHLMDGKPVARGTAANPSPDFTIRERERFAIAWLRAESKTWQRKALKGAQVPSAELQGEVKAALAIADKAEPKQTKQVMKFDL